MKYREEHPRPELSRPEWMSLNGEWEFEIDNKMIGKYEGYEKRSSLSGKINVPFCPESKLSGVEYTGFMYAVWYRRELDVPSSWRKKRIILHFGACDYETTVYINGREVGKHLGGYTPFSFDITDFLKDDGNYVTVHAEDDMTSSLQMSGKQSKKRESYGCFYTRTTGIWQTVWLEAVSEAHVLRYSTAADLENSTVTLTVDLTDEAIGKELRAVAEYREKNMGEVRTRVNSRRVTVSIKLSELHLWELGRGELYQLLLTLSDTNVEDAVFGYFGMREIALKRDGMYLNGKRVYGRFVLDQGFYPDGIYTAPTAKALEDDIRAAMSLGFNGARLHQKVFEPRYLYYADIMGFMVFGETPNWGLDWTRSENIYRFLPEWLEELNRDMMHPSLIGWCPFNETWDIDGRAQSWELINSIYDITRSIDPTRIIVTNSGSYPTTVEKNDKSDAHDVHDYEQNPEKFKEYYSHTKNGVVMCQLYRENPERQWYDPKKPIFVSEYGGIKWTGEAHNTENPEIDVPNSTEAWGYGESVRTENDYLTRLEGLTDVLIENDDIFAFCLTQLTDVEQEQNGLMTYDRKFKFSPEKIARIIAKPAKFER